jgi:phosphoribosylglycinamide formyltransferase-1
MSRILVFASGSRSGGGSGFQELVENSRAGVLNGEIVAVVSQYPEGGVKKRADALGIPFVHFERGGGVREYRDLVAAHNPDLVCLSGWVLRTAGLDPAMTINIHPGPLPHFGGKGMYGHRVHEAVLAAFHEGRVTSSAVTMHFVTDEYDKGPVFFKYPVLIRPDDTPETLGSRVNKIEHAWQPFVTNLVLCGAVSWNGSDPHTLTAPSLLLSFLPVWLR